MFQLEKLPSFPPGNPFHHDLYHMGTEIGRNLLVLHAKFPGEQHDYVILVNPETGERLRVSLTKEN